MRPAETCPVMPGFIIYPELTQSMPITLECIKVRKKRKQRRYDKEECVFLSFRLWDFGWTFVRSPSLQFLSPHTAVELLSEEVKECHHRHIEKKEAHQANRAEEAEQGIHPNPDREVHPQNPGEQEQSSTTARLRTHTHEEETARNAHVTIKTVKTIIHVLLIITYQDK